MEEPEKENHSLNTDEALFPPSTLPFMYHEERGEFF